MDQRNVIIAVALSIALLIGWQFWWGKTHPTPPPQQTVSAPATPAANKDTQANNATQPANANGALPATLKDALAEPRIKIETPSLNGSITLKGARLDDLTLSKYREEIDPKSPPITLLTPAVGTGKGAYYAEFGWSATDPSVKLPNGDSEWTASGTKLTPETPVTLSWDNGAGLVFKRTYAVDADYMFTVTETVENTGSAPVTLFAYGDVARWDTPPLLNYSVLHEGPVAVLDGTLVDKGLFGSNMYKQMREADPLQCGADACRGKSKPTKGGWIGFTDKYWAALLVPDQDQTVTARMFWHNANGQDRYQTDWTAPAQTVAPGASATATSHLFAGAKVLELLDRYAAAIHIPNFRLAIDFGMFRFLTVPLFMFLRFIHAHISNFGLAIMIFTICVRAAFFPIANRSFQSMNKMKALQPEIKKLQARFGDDRAKLNQEMMALYKREKANPVSGCLPLLVQIPVFFSLYKVLLVTIEMRQAPFWGWIHDLSAPDPTTLFNLFGLIPWTPPLFLMIGVWPLIMGVTMYLQQKMNPTPPDPVQARMFMILPVVFTFMMAKFPAGLVIYWSWSNTLSIAQQWLIRKRAVRK